MKKHRLLSILTIFSICMSCTAFAATNAAFGDVSAGNHPAAPYAESEIIVPRPDTSKYAVKEKYRYTGIPADVKGHWAEEQITYFLQNGSMKAENGKFNPDAPVRYTEFAQTVSRLGLKPVEFNGGSISYKIFDDYALWKKEHPDVKAAFICAEAGVWGNPYEANYLVERAPGVKLGDEMQRQYLSLFLVNMLKPSDMESTAVKRYADLTKCRNTDCRDAMLRLVQEGIITSYADHTLGPENPVTRAELAVMLYQVLEKAGFDMDTVSDHLYGNYHSYFWEQEAELLELVNAERKKAGKSKLVYDADLNALCEIKMLEKSIYGKDTFEKLIQYDGKTLAAGHVSQFYGRATEMAKAFGLSDYLVGENAVMNCPNAVKAHDRLTDSPAHRENYLKEKYEIAGFAVGGTMTYEMFAYFK